MVESNTIEALTKALSQDPQNTNNTYNAVVSRVDNENVVWVHVAGSDKETPTASTSAEVKQGDSVTVEWRNNKLYIAGNYSNPSAGAIRVNAVEVAAQVANEAAQSAVTDAGIAREAAESVKGIAVEAQRDADSAKKSATTAINQLGYIEDVVGTLNWIAEHGEYSLSTDTEVQDGKLYFNRVTQEELIQLPYSEDNPTTINGITYTVADDGTITANGTATADSEYGVKRQNWTPYMELEAEEYKLTGCPIGGGDNTYSLFATYGSGQGTSNPKYGTDYGSGAVFTGRTGQRTGVWIVIKNGVTVSDLAFTPSLKLNIADRYELVTNPTGSPTEHGWYELTSVDEAVSNYVAAHLALTDEGLYVQTDREEGWRVLIKGNGVYIIDDGGDIVAEYSNDIIVGNAESKNTKVTNDGFAICDGDNVYASFDLDGIRLGANDSDRLYINPSRFAFVDEDNTSQVDISSDLVKRHAYILEQSYRRTLTLGRKPVEGTGIAVYRPRNNDIDNQYGNVGINGERIPYLFIAGTAQTAEGITYDGDRTFDFSSRQTSVDGGLRVRYISNRQDWDVTLGDRVSYIDQGRGSISIGSQNLITGDNSCAIGNYLNVFSDDTIVVGKYNNELSDAIFAVGAGQQAGIAETRRNAFEVKGNAIEVNGCDVHISGGPNNEFTYNHNKVLHEGLSSSTPSVSVTASTGNFVSAIAKQYGKIVQLSIKVNNPNSVASGGNIFVGTLNTTALRPAMWTTGVTYKGSYAIVGSVGTTGVITVRNSDSRVHNNGDDISVTFTYLIP